MINSFASECPATTAAGSQPTAPAFAPGARLVCAGYNAIAVLRQSGKSPR